ncbi:hypothetical protein [Cytobacillus gottheilii]|uniref:hypothetical protein n=1 Tax=Cytobacillus gottheilii TaxID=859144 RepID=UPI002494086B|nr:hypothetical protein [Cytobacillus gottheilii]
MERKRPTLKNKHEIPVNIYRGETLIAECPSIQTAAKFFKQETQTAHFKWSAIHNGIWHNEPYSFNGATYFFLTDEEAVRNKLNLLNSNR